MNYPSINHYKKKYSKKLSIEYKKPTSHSEKSDNEQKSKNPNMDKENLNLFKGIIKVTKKSLKEKKTPETQSNTINNDIFDFTNFVYNNEEHLNNDKFYVIKSSKNNNSQKYNNVISPSGTLKSKHKAFNKYKSSLDLMDFSKKQNIKKTLLNKNSNKFSLNYYTNNLLKRKQRRRSVIGNMTHKNRNIHNFHFFFKLKEKDKIPSKTPYLDKIWSFSNNKLNFKPKSNIHTKYNSEISLVKQNSHEINTNKMNKTNIKYEKEKNEIFDKPNSKLKKEKKEENIGKNQGEKMEADETKKNQIIFSEEKSRKTNIIFNVLSNPFFCCIK